ncbi:hypothetical protein Bca4012_057015 [Brassica carinata]
MHIDHKTSSFERRQGEDFNLGRYLRLVSPPIEKSTCNKMRFRSNLMVNDKERNNSQSDSTLFDKSTRSKIKARSEPKETQRRHVTPTNQHRVSKQN